MKKNESRLLLRGLFDELSERERRAFALLLERSPEARAEFDRMRSVTANVRDHASESFAPGFADRVMRAVESSREESVDVLVELLRTLFARVVPAALGLAAVIAVYNLTSGPGTDRSPIETIFGIPRFSVTAAYESALALPDVPSGEEATP